MARLNSNTSAFAATKVSPSGRILEKEQEQVEREKKRLNSDSSSNTIIDINIGGQSILQVDLPTLCMVPDSAFSRIFSGEDDSMSDDSILWSNVCVSRDREGRIFFDQDPSLIESIVNYLRLKRIHALASSGAAESLPPPMPPPKPPKGKKEEFDILLHCFGLTRLFYPTAETSSTVNHPTEAQKSTSRKQKSARHSNERKKAARQGESFSPNVPNIISVSDEGKKQDKKGEEQDNSDTASTDDDDDDDDDDAKTVHLSLEPTDDGSDYEEVQQEAVGGTKRAHRFQDNDNPKSKRMRKSKEVALSRITQKGCSKNSLSMVVPRNRQRDNDVTQNGPKLTIHKENNSVSGIGTQAQPPVRQQNTGGNIEPSRPTNQPNQTTKIRNTKHSHIRAFGERLQAERRSQPIPEGEPWRFLPGKPVDTCTHCPACGDVFQTYHDKLQFVSVSKDLNNKYAVQRDQHFIKKHQWKMNCNLWLAFHIRIPQIFDEDADYTFFRISNWVYVEVDCVKLTVMNFSREVAIKTMRNRFAVARFTLQPKGPVRKLREIVYDNTNGLCKIKTHATEVYSYKHYEKLLQKCREILDEVEQRCMAILCHKNFSARVTSKKMITSVINDLNLITVSKVHAYRLLDEYEKQCGITKATSESQQAEAPHRQHHRQNEEREKSRRVEKQCEITRKPPQRQQAMASRRQEKQKEKESCFVDEALILEREESPKQRDDKSSRQLPSSIPSSREIDRHANSVSDDTNPLRLFEKTSSKSPKETIVISLSDSESDSEYSDPGVQRQLFGTQSSPSSRGTKGRVESDRVYRYASKELPRSASKDSSGKLRDSTIDLTSSDGECDNGFGTQNVVARKTPLKELQKIVTRLKSESPKRRKPPPKRRSW